MAPDPSTGQALPQPKAIRFVTNNDGPYAKRRRINSACLTCRRRKTRCSGERPACETCLKNNHSCGGYGPDTEPGKDGLAGDAVERRANPALEAATNGPASATADDASQASSRFSLSLSIRNRMPYFRYFGPTAIMPGFKQMVVKVKGKQHSTAGTSTTDGELILPNHKSLYSTKCQGLQSPPATATSLGRVTSQQSTADNTTLVEIPMYDTSSVPPPPLITHLCKTFFTHLGCNFPFLQEERFMRDLEEKQVDAILVDSVCALAARFSTDPMLVGTRQSEGEAEHPETPPSEYGQAFAQRAKSAIADTFACPSVAVVQAALLLAYDEFGGSRDSGLWMYLGIAIRMAQDLGMQTLQGLRYEGRDGPTPESVKFGTSRRRDSPQREQSSASSPEGSDPRFVAEQRAVERERIDTFWAVFFLDRVVSSGTGRPVSLRDRDIEISFPSLDTVDPATGWPVPFPALIRVIHLYGRVTDLLNGIKEVSHVTQDVIKRLASMESLLTDIYQNLSQPIYIAACAFLKETAMQSASSNPHSRQGSPPNGRGQENSRESSVQGMPNSEENGVRNRPDMKDGRSQSAAAEKQMAKHTLLATAANQNYQRCYRALQLLETYWAGVKYILTVLEQKAKGVGDPLLYTREEMECALEVPRPEPSFDTPGWRRKLSWGAYIGPQSSSEKDQGPVAALKNNRDPNFGIPGSPMADPSQGKYYVEAKLLITRADKS
ncbi:hypothetical protein SLS56_000418 [Neofusicoccum ribis]|uniref:Zn(2)-C6 fungal-type domain-containing protein n=1 Tax=Neofusicoccum ribis TaxID=45134 RepID=A0ABR3TER5_9PEZI